MGRGEGRRLGEQLQHEQADRNGLGGTGVIGILRNGDGPTVILCADMDALPVKEAIGLPYASTVTAVVPGAGETATGARAMIDDGLFERFPKPELILGQAIPSPAGIVSRDSGVVVLAAAVGLGGGITRDLLIGIPPAVSATGATLPRRRSGPRELRGDAGPGAVTGAATALDHGVGAPEAVVLGALTGIGRGIVRDVLLRDVPVVVRSEQYAIPALVGSPSSSWPTAMHHDPVVPIVAAAVCLLIRLAGMRYEINLPAPTGHPTSPSGSSVPLFDRRPATTAATMSGEIERAETRPGARRGRGPAVFRQRPERDGRAARRGDPVAHPARGRGRQGRPVRLRRRRGAQRAHVVAAGDDPRISGELELDLDGEQTDAGPGVLVHMAAGLPHALRARTPSVMLLTLHGVGAA